MRPWAAIAKKDALLFFRSRSTLFWTLAFPLAMMLLFSAIFGGQGGSMYDVALVDRDGGQLARAFAGTLNSTGLFNLHRFDDLEAAREAVKLGREDLVGLLVIPPGFTENLTSGRGARIQFFVREGNPQTQQAVASMITGFVEGFNEEYRRRALEMMSAYIPENLSVPGLGGTMTREDLIEYLETFASPVDVRVALISRPEVTSETAAYWENEGHWVSIMFAYSFIFSGMVGAAALLASEKMTKTLKRIKMAPASIWQLLAGKVVGELVILTLSQIALVAVTVLILRPQINWSPALVPLVLAGDLAGASLGLLVAEASPDPRAAAEATTAVGVFLQFFIGMYFPVQFLPGPLRAFAKVLPFTKAVQALDLILLQGYGLERVVAPAAYLSISAVIFTALAVALFPKWAGEE